MAFSADEQLARQLDAMCCICNTHRKNQGHDICQGCYETHYEQRDRRNRYFLPEDATYEEICSWEESRKVTNNVSACPLPTRMATAVDDGKRCNICFEEFVSGNDEIMTTECLHQYHSTCLLSWLKQKLACPECNHKVTM